MEKSILENLNLPQPAEHPANSCWQEDSAWCVLCGDSLPSFLSFLASCLLLAISMAIILMMFLSHSSLGFWTWSSVTEQKSWPGLAQNWSLFPALPTSPCADFCGCGRLQLFESHKQHWEPAPSTAPAGPPFPPSDSQLTSTKALSSRRHPKTLDVLQKKKRQKSFGNCCNIGPKCKKNCKVRFASTGKRLAQIHSSHLPSDRLSHAVQLLLSLCWLQSPAYLA